MTSATDTEELLMEIRKHFNKAESLKPAEWLNMIQSYEPC